jgi:peptidoglycan hydrolase-like protein with peptidoglycan-binding domain
MIVKHVIRDTSANRDGWYGPAMERAARDLQRSLGVPVDGILGPVTWDALVRR